MCRLNSYNKWKPGADGLLNRWTFLELHEFRKAGLTSARRRQGSAHLTTQGCPFVSAAAWLHTVIGLPAGSRAASWPGLADTTAFAIDDGLAQLLPIGVDTVTSRPSRPVSTVLQLPFACAHSRAFRTFCRVFARGSSSEPEETTEGGLGYARRA